MNLVRNAPAKPARGSYRQERDEQRAAEVAKEELAIKDAKVRDGHHCCWPERHKCRGLLEGAHIVDKSRGGANHTSNIISVCAWIHRRGPESIHSKDLVVQPLTDAGADGAVAYYRRIWSEVKRGESSLRLIARERATRILERG